jgi:ribosomal protein S18 acetylase RimI-like enzyme
MSAAQFSIRAAQPADLATASRLAAALIRLHHELDSRRFAILAEPLEPGYAHFLAGRLHADSAVVLVADATGTGQPEAVGVAAGGTELTSVAPAVNGASRAVIAYGYAEMEPRSWPDLIDRHGRIHDVIVAPPWRRRGVGTALLQALVDELRRRGAPRVVLATAWRNDGARTAFSRAGFRPTMLEMTLEL